MATVQSDITSGPSKFTLMLALFDRKPANARDVEFTLSGEGGPAVTACVVVTRIEVQDGSGESWIFKGYVRRMLPELKKAVSPAPRHVEGQYRTDTRKGWIKLVD